MSEEFVFDVDFSEAVERRLVPVDWYRVRIERLERKQASTGTPMMVVLLRIVGGEHDGQPLFHNWMLDGKGAGITKAAIRAFLGDETADGQTRFSTSDLNGAEAVARVTHRVWAEEAGGDGELQNNISRYKAISYGEGEELAGLFNA